MDGADVEVGVPVSSLSFAARGSMGVSHGLG